MHSVYHLEFVSRETVAERVRQAERDAVSRRAKRARREESAQRGGKRQGWLALPRALGAIGRRLAHGVTPSAAG